jgi:hypothetical protein
MSRIRWIAAALALLLSAPSAQAFTQVKVYAAKLWKYSGIVVHAGDPITVSSSATWTWNGVYNVGPEGDPTDDYNAFDLFEPFDFFSQARMIAYIGMDPRQGHLGDPGFFPQTSGYISIGNGQTFIAPYSGKLWFGFNDAASTDATGDNKGVGFAAVTVGSANPVGPTITVNSPASVYLLGARVKANFSCSDPVLVGCSGTQANGGLIDTSMVGAHAFVVTANDSNGNTASQSAGYMIVDTSTAGVMPVGAAFDPTFVGNRSAEKIFNLVNPQTTAMDISSIAVQGDFLITGNNCGTSLAAGTHCMIHVAFKPATTGSARGELDVTGSLTVAATPLWGVGTLIRATPNLVFGDQGVGTTSAPLTMTVQNSLGTSMVISEIVASGDFAVDPSTTCRSGGHVLKAGMSCTVAVTFMPTASGPRTGTILVHSPTSAIDPVTTALSGTGTP